MLPRLPSPFLVGPISNQVLAMLWHKCHCVDRQHWETVRKRIDCRMICGSFSVTSKPWERMEDAVKICRFFFLRQKAGMTLIHSLFLKWPYSLEIYIYFSTPVKWFRTTEGGCERRVFTYNKTCWRHSSVALKIPTPLPHQNWAKKKIIIQNILPDYVQSVNPQRTQSSNQQTNPMIL